MLTELSLEAHLVLESGHLIHKVPWPSDSAYLDMFTYVLYIAENNGHQAFVVFHGYDRSNSKKESNKDDLLLSHY